MDAIAACGRGDCFLTFRNPGLIYRFNGGKAYLALNFFNLTDFVFDGADSKLLFSRPNYTDFGSSFGAWSCSPESDYDVMARPECYRRALIAVDTVTRGYFGRFTIDWDNDMWPVSSLVSIVEANATSWTLDFVDWIPGNISIAHLAGFRSLHIVDPELHYCGLVKDGVEFYAPYHATAPKLALLAPHILRIDWDTPGDVPPADPNLRFLLKHLDYDHHGIVVENSRDVQFDQIHTRLVPGKLVVAQARSEGLSFTNFDMDLPAEPSPGDVGNTLYPRHLSAASDGIFIEQTAGRIRLSNVTLKHAGDDCINIHDSLAVDISKLNATYPPLPLVYPIPPPYDLPWSVDLADARKLTVRGIVFADFHPGDKIEFIDPTTFTVLYTDKVVKSASDHCGFWWLEFSKPIPAIFHLPSGRWNPAAAFLRDASILAYSILVDNLTCSSTRARGLLLQTSDTIVANSRVSDTAMACAFIRADLLEREGGGLARLGLYGNMFQGRDRNMWNAGGLDAHVWGDWSNGTRRGGGMEDVAIRGNVFRGIEEPVLAVSASKALSFARNMVSTSHLPAVLISKAIRPEVVNDTFHVPGLEDLGLGSDPLAEFKAVYVDPDTVNDAVVGGNVFPLQAPSEEPIKFEVLPFVPYVPEIPPLAAVLTPSTAWSSKLGSLPDCTSCRGTGYPDLNDYHLCLCPKVEEPKPQLNVAGAKTRSKFAAVVFLCSVILLL